MIKNTSLQAIFIFSFSFMASGAEYLDLGDLDPFPFKRSDRENSAFLDFDLQYNRILDNINYNKSNALKDALCKKIINSGLKFYSTKEEHEVVKTLNSAMLFRDQCVRILRIPMNYENFMEELTRHLCRKTDISIWNPQRIFTFAYLFYKDRKPETKVPEQDTFQRYPCMTYRYEFYGPSR